MGKVLTSDYSLSEERLTPEQIRKALTGDLEGFRYFFNNCCQLQDKDTRQLIHPVLNRGQELIAGTLLKYISKDTRTNYHRECVILAPRQIGKSTLITAISNYMMAYVPGMERINLVHTLQTGTTASKYYSQKIAPIVQGVHKDIFPTIEKNTLGTSTLLEYKDVKGIPRGGFYEVTSAGSNSVRSSTVTVWLADEPSEYRSPEMVEDAISGAIGDYGFSFTAYIGTFSDRVSSYFLDKIKIAIDHPDEMDLVFIPWFLVYGRPGDGVDVDLGELSDYEQRVIIPEMIKYSVPQAEFAQKIGWYRRRALRTSKMKFEFPTSVDDILELTSDKRVFDIKDLERQEKNIESGKPYRLVTDNITKKVEAEPTDASPLTLFRKPIPGHKYKVVVDPIMANNESTDLFAMMVMDDTTLEQAGVFYGREYQLEDYADYAVGLAKIYNRAIICPEKNVAAAFCTCVKALGYYNLYYENQQSRKVGEPGIRTTATSKTAMIDSLAILLRNDRIIIHDRETLDQLNWFEKKIKNGNVKMAARKGKHDDGVACLWIYAGSLKESQLTGRKSIGWTVI